MRLPGFTLAPVTPEKIETSAQILLSTFIYFGAGGSDWLIKFGALFTFYDLKDDLVMIFVRNWC